METQLKYDINARTLAMRARSKMTTGDDLTFRVYGNLNTKDGTLAFDGYGRKFWGFNGSRLHNKDTRLRVGPGFRFTAGTARAEKLFIGPVLKKEIHFDGFGRKRDSFVAKGVAAYEWDLAAFKLDKGFASGKGLLSYKIMKFTDRQDLKLTVGADWTYMPRLRTKPFVAKPFLQVRENNWAATFSDKGKTMLLSYDL